MLQFKEIIGHPDYTLILGQNGFFVFTGEHNTLPPIEGSTRYKFPKEGDRLAGVKNFFYVDNRGTNRQYRFFLDVYDLGYAARKKLSPYFLYVPDVPMDDHYAIALNYGACLTNDRQLENLAAYVVHTYRPCDDWIGFFRGLLNILRNIRK